MLWSLWSVVGEIMWSWSLWSAGDASVCVFQTSKVEQTELEIRNAIVGDERRPHDGDDKNDVG